MPFDVVLLAYRTLDLMEMETGDYALSNGLCL